MEQEKSLYISSFLSAAIINILICTTQTFCESRYMEIHNSLCDLCTLVVIILCNITLTISVDTKYKHLIHY